jgi:hypothetical protein
MMEDSYSPSYKKEVYESIETILNYCNENLWSIMEKIQQIPGLAIRRDGELLIDETICIHKGGPNSLTQEWFSHSEKKYVYGYQIISGFYVYGDIAYPVGFIQFVGEKILKLCGREAEYKKKTDCSIELLRKLFQFKNCPKRVIMDRGFSYKEILNFIEQEGHEYVTRFRKKLNIIIDGQTVNLTELPSRLNTEDFQLIQVQNPADDGTKAYWMTQTSVILPGVGPINLVISYKFPESQQTEISEIILNATPAFFTTNNLGRPMAVIVKDYLRRWMIEAGYQNMKQNLNLNHGFWQTYEKQCGYISLVFLAYFALIWLNFYDILPTSHSQRYTMGELRQIYIEILRGDENFFRVKIRPKNQHSYRQLRFQERFPMISR